MTTDLIDVKLRQLAYCRSHSIASFYMEFDDRCPACCERYELARNVYALAQPKQIDDILKEHRRLVLAESGSKGGKARAANLTPERRRETAILAARSRWKKASSDA